MNRRRMHGVLVSALGLAMGAGAVLAGTGTASAATTTTAATSGKVTLTARGTDINDASPFTKVSVSKACPTDYRDALNVSLVMSDGEESTLVGNLTSGAPYSHAPVTAQVPAAEGDGVIVRSIATAFDVIGFPVVDGTYPVHVTCANADTLAFPEHPASTGFITVTGDTWKVSSHATPIATSLKLTASPAKHVQVGQPFTLTAKVPAGVPGVVQFAADGGVTVVGDPVPVVNGVASIQPPSNTAPNVRAYSATFVPADQLAYAQAYGTVSYTFVNAPSITVADANGTVLGDTPQLAPGQQITVSAKGFQPGDGESVAVSVSNAVFGIFPVDLAPATSDAAGSVDNYTLTIPACLSHGSHKLVLTGDQSNVKITFAFTTH
jgi:hypothetical protein